MLEVRCRDCDCEVEMHLVMKKFLYFEETPQRTGTLERYSGTCENCNTNYELEIKEGSN